METQPYLSPSFNELVFEQRHKQYGAYVLRRSYNRTLILAVTLTCSALLLFGFGSRALAGCNPEDEAPSTSSTLVNLLPTEKPKVVDPQKKPVEEHQKNLIQKGPKTVQQTTVTVTDSVMHNDTTHYAAGPSKDPHGVDSTIVNGDPKKPIDTTGTITDPPVQYATYCDEEPTCVGLESFLAKNIRYPQFCADNGIQGRVILEFTVDVDGSTTDFKVYKSANRLLDNEALRVAQTMPKWKPCSTGGIRAKYIYHLPVVFRLR